MDKILQIPYTSRHLRKYKRHNTIKKEQNTSLTIVPDIKSIRRTKGLITMFHLRTKIRQSNVFNRLSVFDSRVWILLSM